MGDLGEIFQIDWHIFMEGARAWLAGRNPYGALNAEFGPGSFGYPPTALTWMGLFWLLGPLGYYVWTALTLGGWWLLIRRERAYSQLALLCWSPVILHLVLGQCSLPMVLLVWGAYSARRRGWLWGLALALAMTKPQVAILPVLWLLWLERRSPTRVQLWAGLVLGTVLLALPPTLRDPGIWQEWVGGLSAYRGRIAQVAAWQGPSALVLALAAYLWHRSGYGGWQWWLAAGIFPHSSFYGMVVLVPALRPRQNAWLIVGLVLAALFQGPMSLLVLPWILAIHMLAVWMVAGGPRRQATRAPLTLGNRPEQP
jgi:hypothetical protein